MNNNDYLAVENLTVEYTSEDKIVQAVNGVSFSLEKGKALGLVGETGAGKTTIAKAIMQILPVPPSIQKSGKIIIDGEDIVPLSESEKREYRGSKMAMIFQDPMTALNPLMTVGDQIAEVLMVHDTKLQKKEALERAIHLLEMVGIPGERFVEYPHQFSGGMRQRVVIAVALSCKPDLLLADEPTSALDVTIQAQILDLIKKLQIKSGMSMLLITHDLGVVAEYCDTVAIVYAGEIQEYASKEELFTNRLHPYTIGLFDSVPKLEGNEVRLNPIPGLPPDPTNLPTGCKFADRCKYCTQKCREEEIPLVEVREGHFCRCIRWNELEVS